MDKLYAFSIAGSNSMDREKTLTSQIDPALQLQLLESQTLKQLMNGVDISTVLLLTTYSSSCALYIPYSQTPGQWRKAKKSQRLFSYCNVLPGNPAGLSRPNNVSMIVWSAER
jgi:hypothetical protein